jgi:hypothetical protein
LSSPPATLRPTRGPSNNYSAQKRALRCHNCTPPQEHRHHKYQHAKVPRLPAPDDSPEAGHRCARGGARCDPQACSSFAHSSAMIVYAGRQPPRLSPTDSSDVSSSIRPIDIAVCRKK